ncbi:helix-turn-helix domain-containing protein [Streptomyces stelliscabiei]|uniref:helix-turn-helix domain-containing protein n=1 Tax=Streptomyces stelliscabiei TaxID=146820 RepID=UPI003A8F9F4A
MLQTLEHWFAAAGSATEAGRSLFVHPNTVRYRLRRVEELTGRSLTDPRAVAHIGAALLAVRGGAPGRTSSRPRDRPDGAGGGRGMGGGRGQRDVGAGARGGVARPGTAVDLHRVRQGTASACCHRGGGVWSAYG